MTFLSLILTAWTKALVELFHKAFNLDADIDVHRDYDEIQELYVTHNTKKSLQVVYPELLPYFDYDKNKMAPIHIASSSQKKYYWTDPAIQATIRLMLWKLKRQRFH